jgi:hypothetical protein
MRTESEILEKIEEYNKKSSDAFDKYMDAAKNSNISYAEYCYSIHRKFEDFSLQLKWVLGQIRHE